MQVIQSQPSFNGLVIKTPLNTGNLNKLKNFIADEHNIKLLNELEAADTDVYLFNDVENIGFIHRGYGDLAQFGISPVDKNTFVKMNLKKFLASVDKAIKSIKTKKETDSFIQKRGC